MSRALRRRVEQLEQRRTPSALRISDLDAVDPADAAAAYAELVRPAPIPSELERFGDPLAYLRFVSEGGA